MTGPEERPADFQLARRSGEFVAIGRDFVRSFHLLLRTAALHDRENAALERPLQEFLGVLDRLRRLDGSWELRVRNDYLHLCDQRLKVDLDLFPSYHFVVDALGRAGVGAVGVRSVLGPRELLAFVHLLLEAGRLPAGSAPLAHVEEGLRTAGIEGVLLVPPAEGEPVRAEGGADPDVRRRSVLTFVKALYLTRDLLNAVDTERVVNIRRAKRLVSTLVDIMNVDESVLLGLTNIKSFDEYTFNHSVNVCVLAIATGRRLGLDRRQLGELGLAALFHDLGKVSLPHEVISRPGRLEASDWEQIERHPVEGVRKLVQIKGFNDVTNKLIVSVFRHHNNVDGSGYPPLGPDEQIPYFARIIRIADSYDAITSARSYHVRTVSGVEAVGELWKLAGKAFEPAVLKVFIATVGLYPVGTVVQLASGDVGVVVRNHLETEDLTRPCVRVVARWDGQEIEPREIDLRGPGEPEIVGYCTGNDPSGAVLDLLL